MTKRKATSRGRGHCGRGACGCKKARPMKGKGFFKKLGRAARRGVSKVRSAVKAVNQIPGVKIARKVVDRTLSSPLMPDVISEAYNVADKNFRIVNALSKGNVKEAGREALSRGMVTDFFLNKADKAVKGKGKVKGAKHSANTRVRRVAASSSRVNAPVMMRRR